MHGSNSRHGGALLELHTGSDTFVRPSMGSWITYGLGTENQDLPGFVTICPTLTHGAENNYGSAFLPAVYQGTPLGNASIPSDRAKIPFIENHETSRAAQRQELDLLAEIERDHLRSTGPDQALEARIDSFELAFRMQAAAPGLQDLSDESPAMLKHVRTGRPQDRQLRPPVPDGPAVCRSRRPLRPGAATATSGTSTAGSRPTTPRTPWRSTGRSPDCSPT